MPSKYAIFIFYSAEDKGYIAVVPELPGCSVFGKTEEEALRQAKLVTEIWLETAKKEGHPIPKPGGKEILQVFIDKGIVETDEWPDR